VPATVGQDGHLRRLPVAWSVPGREVDAVTMMSAAQPPRSGALGLGAGRADQVGPAEPSWRAGVVKFHAPELVFGHGALAEAGHCALRLGARRPFVVTDPGVIEAGWVAELLGHLAAVGLVPQVWHGVTPNPKDHEIAAAFERYRECDADVIVGIGGGSCIDAAKGVAILTGNGGTILDYAGVDQVEHPIPPLLMIPSTSGTGADVSQFCIVTDTTRQTKVTIMGRALVPDISVTDPRLLTTMPDWLAAATGLDALTHGIEAFVSLAHNPLTDGHALTAVGLVDLHLAQTLDAPADLPARTGMAQASLEAGLAFTNAILGATHAMSHQVGGLLDAPHGVVNGVLLPHVIRFNAADSPDRFVPLARAFGLVTEGIPAAEVALLFAEKVRLLADRVGVPAGLAALGVGPDDVSRLASTTLQDACLTTNPRPADQAEIEALFRAAL
jgi:alcohol dehydrogenase